MHPGLRSPSAHLQPESWVSGPGELQFPAAWQRAERRGAGITWAPCLGGLFLSAAVVARGPGPFVWSSCGRGALERRGRWPSPAPSVRPPLAGVGGRPRGWASPRARCPALGPPRLPGLRGGTRQASELPGRLRSRHHCPRSAEPEAAPPPSGRRHEDQGCQETLWDGDSGPLGWGSTAGPVWKPLGSAACFQTRRSSPCLAWVGGGGAISAWGSRLPRYPPILVRPTPAAPWPFSPTSSSRSGRCWREFLTRATIPVPSLCFLCSQVENGWSWLSDCAGADTTHFYWFLGFLLVSLKSPWVPGSCHCS